MMEWILGYFLIGMIYAGLSFASIAKITLGAEALKEKGNEGAKTAGIIITFVFTLLGIFLWPMFMTMLLRKKVNK